MSHYASPSFWKAYEKLPEKVKNIANKNFLLLKKDFNHPALCLKKVGKYWSARVGIGYRALAIEVDEGYLWFWIGSHASYDKLIKGK